MQRHSTTLDGRISSMGLASAHEDAIVRCMQELSGCNLGLYTYIHQRCPALWLALSNSTCNYQMCCISSELVRSSFHRCLRISLHNSCLDNLQVLIRTLMHTDSTYT